MKRRSLLVLIRTTSTLVVPLVAAFGGCSSEPVAKATSTEPNGVASVVASAVEDAGTLHGTLRSGQSLYEQASVVMPGAESCSIHPEGDESPANAVTVFVEEDGVLRFQAVRATDASSVERLALDCVDSSGALTVSTVDLRSKATFEPRPFDVSRTTLEQRPALVGDPLRYSSEDLLAKGYGLRPDPAADSDGYARWLALAKTPMHKLRSAPTHPSGSALSARTRHRTHAARQVAARAEDDTRRALPPSPTSESTTARLIGAPVAETRTLSTGTMQPWTGTLLSGEYKASVLSPAFTFTYGRSSADFTIPTIYPQKRTTQMSIWSGLDNVFQAVTWLTSTPTVASWSIQRQIFVNTLTNVDDPGPLFAPNANDEIIAKQWYCDSKGNVKLAGGYACTTMTDVTRNLVWDCSQATSTTCPSIKLDPADIGNGYLGWRAEFVLENDTDQITGNDVWPSFSPVTMIGSADVYMGDTFVHTTNSALDPNVTTLVDFTQTGPTHLTVSQPVAGSVEWTLGSPKLNTKFAAPTTWSNTWFKGDVTTLLADVNGDGRADAVGFNGTSAWVMLSNGTSFGAPQNWSNTWFKGTVSTLLADVNADGRADAVGFNSDSTWVMLSTGSGFSAPTQWFGGAFHGSVATIFGDVNGDWRQDAVSFDGSTTWVMLSEDTDILKAPLAQFAPPTKWSGVQFAGTVATLLGDVNGDGTADGVAFNGSSIAVLPSNGNGRSLTDGSFGSPNTWSNTWFKGDVSTLLADVNGDAMADAVGFNGNSTWVMLSNGSGFSVPLNWSSASFSGTVATLLADVDGDGRADAVAFNGGTTAVMLSVP